jgi:hypothetical protein
LQNELSFEERDRGCKWCWKKLCPDQNISETEGRCGMELFSVAITHEANLIGKEENLYLKGIPLMKSVI